MALPLLEAAKLAANQGLERESKIIEMFAKEGDILRRWMWRTIQGNALAYNVEAALAGVAFRGVNESFTSSTAVVNPMVEPLKTAGGELQVDNFILRTQGPAARAYQEASKAKALSRAIQTKLIQGNSATNPREFDGLATRIVIGGSQAIDNGGGALSIAKLDQLLDEVPGANVILITRQLRRAFGTFLKNSTAVDKRVDEYGNVLATYQGVDLLIADGKRDDPAITATETSAGLLTGGSLSSIYALRIADDGVMGLQSGNMVVSSLGELQSTPAQATRIEWDIGLAVFDPYAMGRLYNINPALTAVA